MTLYEMTKAANELYELLGAEEIDEQAVEDTLSAMGVGDKLEDYCKVIRQFEADAEAFKREKDRFDKKQKAAENAITRLETAIKNYMTVTGQEKIKCGMFDLKMSQSKAAKITNVSLIPAVFAIEQPAQIDKKAIRKALLAGEQVAGAELLINKNLSIK